MSAIEIALLTLLGAAGEVVGHGKWLKTNTVKHRTLSLLNQGILHYAAPPKMKIHLAEEFMAKFGEIFRGQGGFRETFGII